MSGRISATDAESPDYAEALNSISSKLSDFISQL